MHTNTSRLLRCLPILLVALLATPGGAQDVPLQSNRTLSEMSATLQPDPPSAAMAAQLGLELLHQLKDVEDDEQYATFLGFDSAQQARQASLGTPLQVFAVTSNQLVDFQDQIVPGTFFSDTHTVTYPLEVDGHVVSSLSVVMHSNNTWSLARLGSKTFIKTVEKYRGPSLNIVIVIPDLGLRFLADKLDGQPTLIPLFNGPSFEFREGNPVTVGEISMKLKGRLPDPKYRPRFRHSPKQ